MPLYISVKCLIHTFKTEAQTSEKRNYNANNFDME